MHLPTMYDKLYMSHINMKHLQSSALIIYLCADDNRLREQSRSFYDTMPFAIDAQNTIVHEHTLCA